MLSHSMQWKVGFCNVAPKNIVTCVGFCNAVCPPGQRPPKQAIRSMGGLPPRSCKKAGDSPAAWLEQYSTNMTPVHERNKIFVPDLPLPSAEQSESIPHPILRRRMLGWRSDGRLPLGGGPGGTDQEQPSTINNYAPPLHPPRRLVKGWYLKIYE